MHFLIWKKIKIKKKKGIIGFTLLDIFLFSLIFKKFQKINDKIKNAKSKWTESLKWLTSTLSTKPLLTIYHPIKPWKQIKIKMK